MSEVTISPLPLFAPPAAGDRVTLYVRGWEGRRPTVIPYVLTAKDADGVGALSWDNPYILFDHRSGTGIRYGSRDVYDLHILGWGNYIPASTPTAHMVSEALREAGFIVDGAHESTANGVPVYAFGHVGVWRADIGVKEWWHAKAFDRVAGGPSPYDAAVSLRAMLAVLRGEVDATIGNDGA